MSSWSPWEDASYCWVVICKNKRYHRHAGADIGYKIPLAETDAVSPKPAISAPFLVRCSDCGVESTYKPEDIQRVEMNLVDSFTTHPLFRRPEDTGPSPESIPIGAPSSQTQTGDHVSKRWWQWRRR